MNSPTRYPSADSIDVIMADVLPLPLVPATCTVGIPLWMPPNRSANNVIRSRWNDEWPGLVVDRSKSVSPIARATADSKLSGMALAPK